MTEGAIPPHGGYRELLSYFAGFLARLVPRPVDDRLGGAHVLQWPAQLHLAVATAAARWAPPSLASSRRALSASPVPVPVPS